MAFKYLTLADVRYISGEEKKAMDRIVWIDSLIDRYLDMPILNDEWFAYVKKSGDKKRITRYVTDEDSSDSRTEDRPEREENRFYNANNNIQKIMWRQAIGDRFSTINTNSNTDRTVEEIREFDIVDGDLVTTLPFSFSGLTVDPPGQNDLRYGYLRANTRHHLFNIILRPQAMSLDGMFGQNPPVTWSGSFLYSHRTKTLGLSVETSQNDIPRIFLNSSQSYSVVGLDSVFSSLTFFDYEWVDNSNYKWIAFDIDIFFNFVLDDGSTSVVFKTKSFSSLDNPFYSLFFAEFNAEVPANALNLSITYTITPSSPLWGGRKKANWRFFDFKVYPKRYDWQKLKSMALTAYYDNLNPDLSIQKALSDSTLLTGGDVLRSFIL